MICKHTTGIICEEKRNLDEKRAALDSKGLKFKMTEAACSPWYIYISRQIASLWSATCTPAGVKSENLRRRLRERVMKWGRTDKDKGHRHGAQEPGYTRRRAQRTCFLKQGKGAHCFFLTRWKEQPSGFVGRQYLTRSQGTLCSLVGRNLQVLRSRRPHPAPAAHFCITCWGGVRPGHRGWCQEAVSVFTQGLALQSSLASNPPSSCLSLPSARTTRMWHQML